MESKRLKLLGKMAGAQSVDALHLNASPGGSELKTGFIKINCADRASRDPWEGSAIHQNANLKRGKKQHRRMRRNSR